MMMTSTILTKTYHKEYETKATPPKIMNQAMVMHSISRKGSMQHEQRIWSICGGTIFYFVLLDFILGIIMLRRDMLGNYWEFMVRD